MICIFQQDDGHGGHHCLPGGKRAGQNVSPGVCLACHGLPRPVAPGAAQRPAKPAGASLAEQPAWDALKDRIYTSGSVALVDALLKHCTAYEPGLGTVSPCQRLAARRRLFALSEPILNQHTALVPQERPLHAP